MGARHAVFFGTMAVASLCFVASAASCSSFDDEPTADAGADASEATVLGDAASDDASDADVVDAPGEGRLCPPPRAGTKDPTLWIKRTIHASGARSWPFAIATDATHVTWVAQVASADGGSEIDAYNGNASAEILRAPKTGAGPVTVLATDQRSATALALDGGDAYWTTWAASVATLSRRPVTADCDAGGCPPAPIAAVFPAGVRITKLVRSAPGVLLALSEGGAVFRVRVDTGAVMPVLTTSFYPALTATDSHLYAASGLSERVQRATIGPVANVESSYLDVPPLDGGNLGVAPIVTDCTSLWMVCKESFAVAGLYEHKLAAAGSFARRATLVDPTYALATDAKYVYAAIPNFGGVFVLDKSTLAPPTAAYTGNVFDLAVDDDGVYLGEHGDPNPGSILMLVKE